MIHRRFIMVPVFILMTLVNAGVATAGGPTEDVRETTDKLIAIVSDPALKAPDKADEKAAQIRKAVDERFDWREMSRRTLARHWKKRTEEEKEEFIKLFGKLLERTYLDKVEGYSGEKVLYVKERVKGKYAIVVVKIITRKDTEILVKYKLKKKEDEWMVYDISIEGVSLVNNYRKQFSSILSRSSYEDLVKRLKKKIEDK
ncbi:MAG: ABC transporter substrate-binding protein [Deltaproteobacteria bacterium]|nr:ABC transporter substrate-binding protein [Deltaproteobacteria bacterium]MBW2112654.1 ABC transporter substrate-binding protein [Deltaproteobacteria bacterium]